MPVDAEYQVIIDYNDDDSVVDGCDHTGPCRSQYTMRGSDAERLARRWHRLPRWTRRFGAKLVVMDPTSGAAHVYRLAAITDIRIQPAREALR